MSAKKQGLEKDPEQLGEPEAEALLEELRKEVRRHDYLYHAEARPEISDEAYDKLFRRLKRLEEAFPHLITADSPTQRVGAEPQDKFETIEHAAQMLSL